MKLACIADIHGNARALEAVLKDAEKQGADRIWVLGDIVFKGPEPAKCVRMVRDLNTVVIQGNIDQLIGEGRIQDGFVKTNEQEAAIRKEMEWTRKQLAKEDLEYLVKLPFSHEDKIGEGFRIRVVHANPQNLLDNIWPTEEDSALTAMFAGTTASIMGYAHIHQPFIRFFQGKTLFNTGSVGLPFDGDRRASYALLETEGKNFQASIRRVPYDVGASVKAFADSDHPYAASVIEALQSGKRPR